MRHLTIEERETIQLMLWKKKSIRAISRKIDRPPSTISREIKRNKDSIGRNRYNSRIAQEKSVKKQKKQRKREKVKEPKNQKLCNLSFEKEMVS